MHFVCAKAFRYLILSCIIYLCCPGNACCQDRKTQLNVLFDTLRARGNFNGCVLIAEGGNILLKKAHGVSDSTGKSLTEKSVFETGSVTKVFTALAIAQLKEKGLVSYDDSLRRFFPELPYSGVTIQHLLASTSGIEDFLTWAEEETDVTRKHTNADLIRNLARRRPPLRFLPGTQFHYSNTNYALLASIVERASGKSFADYMQENVFEKCGMSDSRVASRHSKLPAGFASDFSWDPVHSRLVPTGSVKRYVSYLSEITGAYGIITTIDDLYRFDQALDKGTVITQESLNELLAPATYPGAQGEIMPGIIFRAGWQLIPDGGDMFGSGNYGGYGALLVKKRAQNQTIILLTNSLDTSPIMDIMGYIDEILETGKLNLPAPQSFPRAVKLSPEKLLAFTGKYTDPDNKMTPVTVALHREKLTIKMKDSMEHDIFPESADVFFLQGLSKKLKFTKEGGKSALSLIDGESEIKLYKTK